MENMNSRDSFYDINSFYNKKARLKASYKGMRHQVEQVELKSEMEHEDSSTIKKLRVYVWPGPFCFEKTPDSFKQSEEFEYSEDGLNKAYKWVCGCYMDNQAKWEHAMKFPLDSAKEMGII